MQRLRTLQFCASYFVCYVGYARVPHLRGVFALSVVALVGAITLGIFGDAFDPGVCDANPLEKCTQRTYIHTYIHTYVRTYVHTNILTYVHTYIHTCIHTYIHTYVLTNKQTNIHTYIGTARSRTSNLQYFNYYCCGCHSNSIDCSSGTARSRTSMHCI